MPQEALLCPQCGAPQRGESFCPHCGVQLRERADATVRVLAEQVLAEQPETRVVCSSCGKALGDKRANCPHCGKPQFWQCSCAYKWTRSGEPFCQNCGRSHVQVQDEIQQKDRLSRKWGAYNRAYAGFYLAVLFGTFAGLGALLFNGFTGAMIGIGVAVILVVVAVSHFGSG